MSIWLRLCSTAVLSLTHTILSGHLFLISTFTSSSLAHHAVGYHAIACRQWYYCNCRRDITKIVPADLGLTVAQHRGCVHSRQGWKKLTTDNMILHGRVICRTHPSVCNYLFWLSDISKTLLSGLNNYLRLYFLNLAKKNAKFCTTADLITAELPVGQGESMK